MNVLEKFKKIRKMHIFAVSAVMVCVSILSAYVYAHFYIKDVFKEKLASRGIQAEVESVSLKSVVVLSGINLKVKDSETRIHSITLNYWLTDVLVHGAHISGKVEDYLELRSKVQSTPDKKKTGRSMDIKLSGCDAEMTFTGRKLRAKDLSFSNSDSVVHARLAGVDDLIMEGVDLNLNTNKANIKKLHIIPQVQHKDDGIDIKSSEPKGFHIPTLPNTHYDIYIKQVGENEASPTKIQAKNVSINIKYGKTFSFSVKGKSFNYVHNLFSSEDFSIKVSGTAKSVAYEFSAVNPNFWHRSLRTDVHNYPIPVVMKRISTTGNVKVSDSGLSVKDGKLNIDKLDFKYSFDFDGSLKNYKASMPRTSCEQVMLANPFKSVFHNRCSEEYVDIGRCKDGNDTVPEDTEYNGIIEWSLSGSTVSNPKFGFYSTCSFKSVPWYLKASRFRRPFAMRVGEPVSNPTSDNVSMGAEIEWKPRKEIVVGPGTNNWVPGNLVSYYLERALMVTEDGRFWFHKGVDDKAVSSLIKEILTKRDFNRGGSTITMQLAKNLWLMRHKTFDRKVQEFFLTLYLESIMSKAEIMQLYINVIEFGPNVYGIYDASHYYFKKVPFDLTLKESVFLASILPSPSSNYFAGARLGSGTNSKINYLLNTMFSRGLITQEELEEAKLEVVYKR